MLRGGGGALRRLPRAAIGTAIGSAAAAVAPAAGVLRRERLRRMRSAAIKRACTAAATTGGRRRSESRRRHRQGKRGCDRPKSAYYRACGRAAESSLSQNTERSQLEFRMVCYFFFKVNGPTINGYTHKIHTKVERVRNPAKSRPLYLDVAALTHNKSARLYRVWNVTSNKAV